MKTLLLILLATLCLASSCDKDKYNVQDLEGNWVIKKMLADPGNGSGRYQDVPDNPYLVFHKDGTARSNYSVFGLHMLNSYQVVDSVQVILSFKEQSSQPSTSYRYKLSGDTLLLNPPCIEGCGLKLIRAN